MSAGTIAATSTTASLTVSERFQRFVTIAACRLPASVLRRLAPAQVNAEGEQMAPEIALLMSMAAKAPDYSDLDPAGARTSTDAEARVFGDRTPPLAVVEEIDLGDGLMGTRYRASKSSRGLVLFFHGGGFVLGNRESYDAPARLLAIGSQADVLSVEYRLAPEHPFPAAHDDALAAWTYAVEHAAGWGLDPTRIAVAGDSAGANIAAVLCQQLATADVRPFLQVLLYPTTDLSSDRPSHAEFVDNPALTEKQLAWFKHHYLPQGTDLRDPRVSPHLGELTGLPPAIVSVAGFDPLRDEGLEYAAKLLENGVPTHLFREAGLVHGFLSYTALSPASRAATNRVATAVARALVDTAPVARPS
jgi:acetyl esterase